MIIRLLSLALRLALSPAGLSLALAWFVIPSGHLLAVIAYGLLGPFMVRAAMRLSWALANLADAIGP